MFGINKLKRDINQLKGDNERLESELNFRLGNDVEIVIDYGKIKIKLIRKVYYQDIYSGFEDYSMQCSFLQTKVTIKGLNNDRVFNTVKEAEEEKKNIIKERLGII